MVLLFASYWWYYCLLDPMFASFHFLCEIIDDEGIFLSKIRIADNPIDIMTNKQFPSCKSWFQLLLWCV